MITRKQPSSKHCSIVGVDLLWVREYDVRVHWRVGEAGGGWTVQVDK